LWHAVDEHGVEVDVLVQKRRDKAAAKRFFRWVLRSNPVPREIVTDQLRSYPAAKADIPELAQVKHVFVKAAARVNNRAQNSHQPTRRRERKIPQGDFLRGVCGFRDARRTQTFLSCFGPIRQHFALPRHQMNAAGHRAILKERLATWHDWTVSTRSPPSYLIRITTLEFLGHCQVDERRLDVCLPDAPTSLPLKIAVPLSAQRSGWTMFFISAHGARHLAPQTSNATTPPDARRCQV
jgi:hypothetical protein